jgi:ribosomal protein L36
MKGAKSVLDYAEIISQKGTTHLCDPRPVFRSVVNIALQRNGRVLTLCGMWHKPEQANPEGPSKGKRCRNCEIEKRKRREGIDTEP